MVSRLQECLIIERNIMLTYLQSRRTLENSSTKVKAATLYYKLGFLSQTLDLDALLLFLLLPNRFDIDNWVAVPFVQFIISLYL